MNNRAAACFVPRGRVIFCEVYTKEKQPFGPKGRIMFAHEGKVMFSPEGQ